MSSKKKKICVFLGKVILVTLLIVLFIRGFFVESFTISSSQMEASLSSGDKVFINKTAYGIRLPVTLLSVPFRFDSIFGGRSYSSLIQLPYKRLLESTVTRNDIVLFNNPVEVDKPLDKRGLFLSRCVALPGDTIEMRQGIFFINDNPYISSPNLIEEYVYAKADDEIITETLVSLGFSTRNRREIQDTVHIHLSRFENYILKESLPEPQVINNPVSDIPDYELIVPYRGKITELDEQNIAVYEQIIMQEQKGRAVSVVDGKLLIDGTFQKYYTFTDNYYWMISDNADNLSDSRSIGFVPHSSIIGKASYIWQSRNEILQFSKVK